MNLGCTILLRNPDKPSFATGVTGSNVMFFVRDSQAASIVFLIFILAVMSQASGMVVGVDPKVILQQFVEDMFTTFRRSMFRACY